MLLGRQSSPSHSVSLEWSMKRGPLFHGLLIPDSQKESFPTNGGIRMVLVVSHGQTSGAEGLPSVAPATNVYIWFLGVP